MKTEMEAQMRERATELTKLTRKYGIEVETLFEDDTEDVEFESGDADEIQFLLGYFDGMAWFFDDYDEQHELIGAYAMNDIERARSVRHSKPRK